MQVKPTNIPGLFTVSPRKYDDPRGFFAVPFNVEDFAAAFPGIEFSLKQVSHSRSVRGVLRGIHIEPWNKLIYVARGEVFVAIVDVRPGENFGALFTATLGEGQGIFVPKGCGNSFQVVSENVDYIYSVDGLWEAGVKYPAVAYNDPELGIQWPVEDPILSEKDTGNGMLADFGKDRE